MQIMCNFRAKNFQILTNILKSPCSIYWHIVVTSEDTTSYISEKGVALTRMCSDMTDSIVTLDDFVHIQFEIVKPGTVGLGLVQARASSVLGF